MLRSTILAVLFVCFSSAAISSDLRGWHLDFEKSLDSEAQRLTEILDELGEIGAILDASVARIRPDQTEEDLMQQIVKEINVTRIPGFVAYNLSQEGISLLSLLSVRAAWLEKEGINSPQVKRKIEAIKKTIYDTEPLLREAIDVFEPWKNLDGEEIAEGIARRTARDKR